MKTKAIPDLIAVILDNPALLACASACLTLEEAMLLSRGGQKVHFRTPHGHHGVWRRNPFSSFLSKLEQPQPLLACNKE